MRIEEAKVHPWVTDDGQVTLPTREQNCHLVEVSDQEVANAVTCIKWGTMVSYCATILVTMVSYWATLLVTMVSYWAPR